jgi:hypothetical protein
MTRDFVPAPQQDSRVHQYVVNAMTGAVVVLMSVLAVSFFSMV